MAHLSISLLGEFSTTLGGGPITGYHSDKGRALLAYLAVESEQAHRRARLAGLLWPDWPERAARTYLRQALFDLRRLLGDRDAATPFLIATYHTIQFNPQSDHALDVTALIEESDRASKATSSLTRAELERLRQVTERCAGDFMEGVFLEGCSAYEEWQLLTRERLRRRQFELLRALADGFEHFGDFRQALSQVWLRVELEPFFHQAHGQAIRLLARTGESGAALAHYRRYCRMLEEELGAAPDSAITSLIDQIRTGRLPPEIEPEIVSPRSDAARDMPRLPLTALLSTAKPPRSRPPFVARETELAQMAAHLKRALDSQGKVVFVRGDAGQGKTSLLYEFARQAQANFPSLVVAAGACDAHTGMGDPYQPFREVFGLLTGEIEPSWRAGAITRRQAVSLWNTFPFTVNELLEAGPDLINALVPAHALLTRVVDSGLDEVMDTARLRRIAARESPMPSLQPLALYEQTVVLLRALAQRFPLLLVLEDLHWADPGSISLLFHLGRYLAGTRILIVGSYRPEEIALGRNGEPHPLAHILSEFQQMCGEITVDLSGSDGRNFVEALLDAHPNRLGDGFREALYQQSRGHALFTVELLRTMQERGELVRDREGRWIECERIDWEALPARVEAAIAGRIDRLPAHLRDLLSIASVEGERFTAEIVAQIVGLDEREIIRRLSTELDRKHQLVAAYGIRRVDGKRLSQYRFRHILFQRYLYGHLDAVERAVLHERVGTALEGICGDREEALDAAAPRLARHFHQAQIYKKAVVYFYRAGASAWRKAANKEARTYLETALSLLEHIADVEFRAEQELNLMAQLAATVGRLHGQGDPIVTSIYRRVLALSEQTNEPALRFQALRGLWISHWLRGDLDQADRYAEQMLVQAQTDGESIMLAYANSAKGHVRFTSAALVRSRAHFEQAVAYCDELGKNGSLRFVGADAVTGAYSFLAFNLWLLGYPDQASARIEELISFARSGMHPYDLAQAYVGRMGLHHYRREAEKTRETAESILALSDKYGFVQWHSWSSLMHGWAMTTLSGGSQAIEEMESGSAAWPGQSWGARRRAIMADAYAAAGRPRRGLALLDEALEIVERTRERLFEAEIHRLRGELLWMLRQDGREDVTWTEIGACFRRAMKIAHRQQARSWELRAAVSLSRLLLEQGKRDDARQTLTAIFAWFGEGFDTPDLRDACSLLAVLTDSPDHGVS